MAARRLNRALSRAQSPAAVCAAVAEHSAAAFDTVRGASGARFGLPPCEIGKRRSRKGEAVTY